jgi:hypothetical protein
LFFWWITMYANVVTDPEMANIATNIDLKENVEL